MEYAFRSTLTRILLVLGVLALATGIVWAQGGTGELQGVVSDPSGAVVANVSVNLTNSATGDKRTTVTTPAGLYRFVALPVVGTYTLEMSPKGFKSSKIANIVISVGTAVNQDVHLELGATSEQVTVEAGVQQVQTTESSLSNLVDRRTWQSMPLETRSQNDFINLMPGAVQGSVAFSLNAGTDRGAAVNGTRSGTGNYLVEGFDNNDQGLGGGGSLVGSGGANTTISPDAIQEYRVIEHNFSAEYGKAGGFVTDTVLKSGTNQWHGSLFEYNRIQALAAENWFSNFNNVKDSLVRNQFGGSVGGPIVKDKTFFYFSTEFHRLRQSTPLTATSTTDQFLDFVRTGEFENFIENTFCEGGCVGFFSDAATTGPIFDSQFAAIGSPVCVVGAPNCTLTTNGVPGQDSFTGVGIYTYGLVYPVPLYGTLTVPQPSKTDQTRYTVKMDHKLTNNDQLTGTFLYDNADSLTKWAGGGAGGGGFGVPLSSHGRAMNSGITWTHTFSPTVLNQARVAYTRHTGDFPGDPTMNSQGVPSVFTGFDAIAFGFGNSSNLPQFFTENEFQYKDDLSVTKGKHSFKAGGEYRRTRNGSSFQSEVSGLFVPYTLEDLVTDLKFSDIGDGYFFGGPAYGSVYYIENTINPAVFPATRPDYYRGFRANEMAAYFQDDWRIHPRLTLNLGVRWEYFGPPHNFKPNVDANFYTGAPVTPILCSGAPCTNPFLPVNNPELAAFATGTLQVKNSDIWHKDTNNWAPRFGFAYDTFGNQKLVIRGAYGIAYDRLYNNVFENIRFNPPFFCFCNFGAFRNGVPGGGDDAFSNTPGLYTFPYNGQGLFNDPNFFPTGLPKTSPRAIDQNLVTAYYEQANFGFEYELAKDYILETNYVNTLGRKLVGIVNLNTFPGRSGAGFSSTRPNPVVNNINLRTNGFSSNYNALQIGVRKRYSYGLQFNASYTYAKALDQISDTFTPRGVAGNLNPTDSLNVGLDNGPADFDVKHRFVISYSYDLPFYKNNRWIGGWNLSGIVTAQTGVPFSLTDSSSSYDLNRNGTFNDRISYIGGGSITHALTGSGPGGTKDAAGVISGGYFDQMQFAPTVCPDTVNDGRWCEGTSVGQSTRNTLYGPGYTNVDFSVQKKFKITENTALQFQANFFNLFNHPNFALPQGNINSGDFGRSTSAFDPRITQLALRFDF